MKALYLLLVYLLLSCSPCRNDGVIEESVVSGAVVPSYSELALQVMAEKLPCSLSLSGDIVWYRSPLDQDSINFCYIPAWGCADPWFCEFTVWIATYNPRTEQYLSNVWETALVNEIGYWVWLSCYDRMPEHYITNPDGSMTEILDPDFRDWINLVNTETKTRAFSLIYSGPK